MAQRRDLSEFRCHWKPLLACFLGMGSALSINSFIMSNFAPYLLKEFGWTQAQWAGLGVVTLLVVFMMPIVGFLADRYGVRRVAGVGMIAFPLTNLLYSQSDGDIRVFFAIYLFQTILCSSTTATIYTRLVAQNFNRWRGFALGLCATSPGLFGLFGSPLITQFAQSYGWRNGFIAVAAFSAVCGLISFLLIPPETGRDGHIGAKPPKPPVTATLKSITSKPCFWILAAAAFLVSAHHALFTMSLKLVMQEQGATDMSAALLISVFSFTAIAGRLLSGLALDLLKPHLVAAAFLAMPIIGLLLVASDNDSMTTLVIAFALVGLAFGGEGDIIGYLIARLFGIEVFSTVMGIVTAAIAAAISLGSILMSRTLASVGSFTPFLLGAAVCVAIGCLLILMLGRYLTKDETNPTSS